MKSKEGLRFGSQLRQLRSARASGRHPPVAQSRAQCPEDPRPGQFDFIWQWEPGCYKVTNHPVWVCFVGDRVELEPHRSSAAQSWAGSFASLISVSWSAK